MASYRKDIHLHRGRKSQYLIKFIDHRLPGRWIDTNSQLEFDSIKCEIRMLTRVPLFSIHVAFSSVQSLSRVRLCDPMNHSTPGLPVHHQLPEFTQTHVHWVSDTIQPSHPLLSPSPPAPNPFQHQSLFQWVNSSHEVAKVLEFQL